MSDEVCSCGNRFDGDNLCMLSACQWEGIEPAAQPTAPDLDALRDEVAKALVRNPEHPLVTRVFAVLRPAWETVTAERDEAERELRQRELHHFETEQENAALRERIDRVKALADEWACDPVGDDLWRSDAVDDLRAALAGPAGDAERAGGSDG
jgi:hypothetical protein